MQSASQQRTSSASSRSGVIPEHLARSSVAQTSRGVGSGRNITPVLEKVRPTTHRGNGSDREPEAGLSEGRLSLVHRYMVDAEQAEALGLEAAAKAEARATEARAAAAQEQARREAAERTRRRMERERRRAEKLGKDTAAAKPATDPAAEKTPEHAPPTDLKDAASHPVQGPISVGDHPDPRETIRTRKARARADKRAAKQAAREIAALEKREARERRALAKAAARRKTA